MVLFLYPYLIYPGLLYLFAKRMAEKKAVALAPEEVPPVAMVICALNEEKVIGQKMDNCLALQYPRDRFRVIVVSDGSTDRTGDIVRQYAEAGIELIEQKKRRGKGGEPERSGAGAKGRNRGLLRCECHLSPGCGAKARGPISGPHGRVRFGEGDSDGQCSGAGYTDREVTIH